MQMPPIDSTDNGVELFPDYRQNELRCQCDKDLLESLDLVNLCLGWFIVFRERLVIAFRFSVFRFAGFRLLRMDRWIRFSIIDGVVHKVGQGKIL